MINKKNNEIIEINNLSLALITGDLPELAKYKKIRVLVTHNKSNFFVVNGQPRGFAYDLFLEYAQFLNNGKTRFNIVFIPTPFEEILPALQAGRGDIAAAGLTITPERQKLVAFTEPYLKHVEEIVVTNKKVKDVNTLDDLSGKKLYVLRNSTYVQHLKALNIRLRLRGKRPMKIIPSSKNLATEDILELVHAGIIDITVADRHIAELWSSILENIRLKKKIKVNKGGQLAWAVRKNNPKLLHNLNAFVKRNKKGTLLGNIIFRRYYQNTQWIRNPLVSKDLKMLVRYSPYFKKYSNIYGFDWRAIAAQAYQESGFDHHRVSPKGAIGIMQVRPQTAKSIGFQDISVPWRNIHAGVKYMHYLREAYFKESEIEPWSRFYLTLAAYNAGPSRIKTLREEATRMGLDKNKWFSHVEQAAINSNSRETVRYVSNIHKYYVALTLINNILNKKSAELNAIKIETIVSR